MTSGPISPGIPDNPAIIQVLLEGPQGAPGLDGAPGRDGADGVDGAPGERGSGYITGSGAPTSADGEDGDYWIDGDASPKLVYGPKRNGQWPSDGEPFGADLTPQLEQARDETLAAAEQATEHATTTQADRQAVETSTAQVEEARSEVATNRRAVSDDAQSAAGARDAAETAASTATTQAGVSETARQAAEAARDVVLPARDVTTAARDQAVAAAATAEDAADRVGVDLAGKAASGDNNDITALAALTSAAKGDIVAAVVPTDLLGAANLAAAAARALNKPWLLPEASNVTLSVGAGQPVTTLAAAVKAISRWIIPADSTLTLQLPAGKTVNPTLVWTHPYGDRIAIAGQNSTNLTPTSFVGVTGTRNNWQTTIEFASAGGAAVGDYVLAWNTFGTGNHEVLRGVYPVTAVSGNQITLRNTGWYSSFPTPLTLTGGGFALLKTVLRFEGVDGIVIKGSRLGSLRNVVLEGNADEYWLEADVAGTEKGTHGIIVGSPTLLSSNPSSNLQQAGNPLGVGSSSVSLGLYVGVFGFDQQGIASAMGSSTFANFSASSNNRRRGYYADTSSAIWAKNLSAGGNFLDGVIGDNNSDIYASSNSASVGNGRLGVFSAASSMVDFGTGVIKANVTGGVVVQNSSSVQTTGATIAAAGVGTTTNGVLAQHGGSAVLDGSSVDGFSVGVVAQSGGSIRSLSAVTVTNSSTVGVRSAAGGVITLGDLSASGNTADVQNRDLGTLVINGVPIPQTWTDTAGFSVLKIINGSNFSNFAVTGIGDIGWSTNGIALATMKSVSGTFFPNTTSATLGRTGERWVNVFATKASFSVTSLSAAGGGQAGAARLDNTYTDVTTVASGAGVRLNYAVGERQEVWNSGANPLSVYPPTGAQIGTAAANAPVTVAVGGHAAFVAVSATQWRQMP